MRDLFTLTNPHSIEQLYKVQRVLREHPMETRIVYQSNYNMIVACSSKDVCTIVVAQLYRINRAWFIESRKGRKTNRMFFKLTFSKE